MRVWDLFGLDLWAGLLIGCVIFVAGGFGVIRYMEAKQAGEDKVAFQRLTAEANETKRARLDQVAAPALAECIEKAIGPMLRKEGLVRIATTVAPNIVCDNGRVTAGQAVWGFRDESPSCRYKYDAVATYQGWDAGAPPQTITLSRLALAEGVRDRYSYDVEVTEAGLKVRVQRAMAEQESVSGACMALTANLTNAIAARQPHSSAAGDEWKEDAPRLDPEPDLPAPARVHGPAGWP